ASTCPCCSAALLVFTITWRNFPSPSRTTVLSQDLYLFGRNCSRGGAMPAPGQPPRSPVTRPRTTWLLAGAVLWAGSIRVHAQELASSSDALKRLSLEQLMDVEVTSVSKAPESLIGAAAAVTTVTAQDIERSGAQSVPEALRFVP